jgi:hypothetical protein
MRHGPAGRRHRHRGQGGGNNGNNNGNRRSNNNRMQVFDSNGPDVRIRGTAHQVVEKYLALAKDAASTGDRVLSESYLQHAEHYQRIINSWDDDVQPNRQQFYQPGVSAEPFVQQGTKPDNLGNQKTDLALPPSILGGSSKAELKDAQVERTSELTS